MQVRVHPRRQPIHLSVKLFKSYFPFLTVAFYVSFENQLPNHLAPTLSIQIRPNCMWLFYCFLYFKFIKHIPSFQTLAGLRRERHILSESWFNHAILNHSPLAAMHSIRSHHADLFGCGGT